MFKLLLKSWYSECQHRRHLQLRIDVHTLSPSEVVIANPQVEWHSSHAMTSENTHYIASHEVKVRRDRMIS